MPRRQDNTQHGITPTRRGKPILEVTRKVKPWTKLVLYVEAGGRCEYDGCNDYLLEDPLTLTAGNFGEAAHIVAFRPAGPRGRNSLRPTDINQLSNLMLLCGRHHKLVDNNPQRYTAEGLRKQKLEHEARIKRMTGLGPDRKTAVLVLKAPINGHTVTIPEDQVFEATAPRYPTSRNPETIDLTTITDGEGFMRAACETITQRVDRFLGVGGDGKVAGHVSVFALGPIPLLICLGRQLSSKVPTELFQRHRDTERWTWKPQGPLVKYTFRRLRRSSHRSRVALVLALSGAIRIQYLPAEVRQSSTIYAITLDGQAPRTTFLRTRSDLEAFRIVFQEALGAILRDHGVLKRIDLFPAVPAPVAVLCGRELLPKVHPSLRVWDYNKSNGGFTFQLEV